MSAARNFAGSIKTGNGFTVLIECFSLRIDADAAHRMVNRRNSLDDVVLAGRQIFQTAAVVEV